MFGFNYKSYNQDRIDAGYNPKSPDVVLCHFYLKAQWELKFAFLPKRCAITKRLIWLEYAYCGTALWRSGDWDFVREVYWHSKDEHLIWELKR